RDLGELDAVHDAGPKPPVFDRQQPSISSDQFVLRAWAAGKRSLRNISPGVYEEDSPGRIGMRLAITTEGADQVGDNGTKTRLCLPGQPLFDRLAEEWAKKQSHRVFDLTSSTELEAQKLASSWLEQFNGASFVSAAVRGNKPLISGSVLVLVTAQNGLDQY